MEKTFIEQFSEEKSKERAKKFYVKAMDIIGYALEDLSRSFPLLTPDNTRVFPIGEYTSDTFIDEVGEIEVIVAVSDPQITLANRNYIKNYSEEKKEKNRKNISIKGTSQEIILNLFNSLIPYFSEETVLMVNKDGIKILCNQEYEFKILIRFGTYDINDDDFKISLWNPLNMTQSVVDVFKYHEILDKKDVETNGNYKKFVRILKNIRKTILINKWSRSNEIDKYFVELIAYNVPNLLLSDKNDDIYKIFIKSMNYLINCDLQSFKDFEGKDIKNFTLSNINYSKIKTFLNYASRVAF